MGDTERLVFERNNLGLSIPADLSGMESLREYHCWWRRTLQILLKLLLLLVDTFFLCFFFFFDLTDICVPFQFFLHYVLSISMGSCSYPRSTRERIGGVLATETPAQPP